MKFFITGGAGFIGSTLIRHIINNTSFDVVNIDSLTYAGNIESLSDINSSSRYAFEKVDICDRKELNRLFYKHNPNIVMHLAAESHVDRSIDGPLKFLETNIIGTFNLLEESRIYFKQLSIQKRKKFKFHHISTDEVYGDLDNDIDLFSEKTPYDPSSPYSASKASSDHLVRAWGKTYNLPFVITNCSNNYGPYQFPEKLIPHIIINALCGKDLPIYGKGNQIRDWLFVEDHVKALLLVALKGISGQTYNIGGNSEKTNLDVVETICELLEELNHKKPHGVKQYKDLIQFVDDRPGHDRRYAIDTKKINTELNWSSKESFDSGLRKTVEWYLNNNTWWERVLSKEYKLDRIGKTNG